MATIEVLQEGSVYDIYICIEDGKSRVLGYASNFTAREYAQFQQRMDAFTTKGAPQNPDIFERLEDDIFLLGVEDSLLVGFFLGRRKFVFTSAFSRNSPDSVKQSHLRLALRLRKEVR